VIIPNSVEEIYECAFENCTSLESITVSQGNKGYYDIDGVLFCKDKKCLLQYPPNKSDTEYRVPDGVMQIEDYAFTGCRNLKSMMLPKSVINVRHSIFENMRSLENIYIAKDSGQYSDIDGVLFDKELKELIKYPVGRKDKEYIIPNGTKKIGSRAFIGCESLTSVTIPKDVMRIDHCAFENCENLVSIVLPDGLKSIDVGTFCGCTSLESMTIPCSVRVVGLNAFTGCVRLNDVYYTGSEEEWRRVMIGAYNDCLDGAFVHCDCNS